MSVTQYIGARYVPLFADPIEWDSSKTYEPLTIVYSGGNSYTSRQFVPAGIPIDNDSYWALTGNYNAQIEQYRTEVARCDERIEKNSTDIAKNSTDIAKNTKAIAAEVARATEAEKTKAPNNHASQGTTYGIGTAVNYGHVKLSDDIGSTSGANNGVAATPNMANMLVRDVESKFNAKLKTKVDVKEFAGKKLVTIGDSIMLGTGTTSNDTKSIHAQIAAMLDMTVCNYAENNAGFTTNGSGSRKANYLGQLQAAKAEVPDADVIVISGGCNDATQNHDVHNAALEAFQYARDNFPNAKIFTAPFQYGACQGADTIANGNDKRNLKTITGISLAALETNIPIISHCWEMMVGQPDLLKDAIHPNDKGARLQAAKIVMGMLGYDYRPSYYDLPTAGENISINELTAYCLDGMVTVQGTCKTKGTIGAFNTIATLPAYANRASSRMNGGMLGSSWEFIGLYHSGRDIKTPKQIGATEDVYVGQETYSLGM